MAQHDYDIANQSGSAFRADLNNALQAIVSSNAGASAPSTTYAHQVWVDNSVTPAVIKRRDASNSSWISVGTIDSAGQAVWAGGAEAYRVDSSGRVLIGTNSARTNLFSSGTYGPFFQVETANTLTNRTACLYYNANDNGGGLLALGKSRGTSVGSNTVVQSSDELGGIYFLGSDGTKPIAAAYIGGLVDATPGASDMPGRLVFSTTADGAVVPTERMRITSAGLLNLGTSFAPSGVHDIRWQGVNRMLFRNTDATAANCYGIQINYPNATPNGTSNEFIYCDDPGAAGGRFVVRSNGGIANFQANNVNLSDRNVKKDISAAGDTWDCVKEWEIVHYRYKDQPDDADLNLGVIAQQVAESCPELITSYQAASPATDDSPAVEERLGVKEQQMYWMAIKALQEAMAKIEVLEAKVAALEAA